MENTIPFEPTQQEADKLKRYFDLKAELGLLEKEMKEMFLLKAKVAGASKVDYNGIGSVSVVDKQSYKVQDLEKLPKKYILIKKALDTKMIKEVLEMGETLPDGVVVLTKPVITFKPVKK